ncbi:UTP--glucose-1-phosphate uridylyltransferase GalU [Suttonella ornithocola]|uniref:UTP--glucose-1-phosphate uridylyltransferase n=1 Tax=Suttonella ornithocola TaxID=279832 RepID=A0A380MR81_9GAMM|nr:UTP--glucose-1-phosphate uridylyltransferase GalU [Suttonella ornithocola]SUO94423.1 UTP--glucose-1-phosphate uridylyltransferase [Suttonella ornithocola]
MTEKVNLAVFPVAGFGTRFLPATKSTPKEMLPIVDKPLIQYAVEEAYDAGIRNMVFVTGRNKWSITEHYDIAYELENELNLRGKKEFIEVVSRIKPKDMSVMFIRQEMAMGLGHAVLCAEPIVRDHPCAILLADDLITNPNGAPVMKQMVDLFEKHQQGIIGVQAVPHEHTHRYGIITEGAKLDERTSTIEGIVEKPKAEEAPSNLAAIGRYILPGQIMSILKNTTLGAGGEIQLTDAIQKLIKEKVLLAYRFEGKRYDCGDKLGYLEANVEMGLLHPQLGEAFRDYLQNLEL